MKNRFYSLILGAIVGFVITGLIILMARISKIGDITQHIDKLFALYIIVGLVMLAKVIKYVVMRHFSNQEKMIELLEKREEI